ncbi:MAG: sigma-70 family RNA polymerase sigma factor [Oscillospiraceae bacterium]|nr:sigma-70 family RNA polymerase sigma factor [Oscillospiraceae bacterium]
MDNGASSYRRYLNGDESAFHEIVKEYFDGLVLFLYRFVGDLAAAEDLALDAFTQLVVHKHRYNFRVSLKTYLFMIGRSRALDYIKHRKKLGMVCLDQAAELPSCETGPEEQLIEQEEKRQLHEALSRLEEKQRLVLHLVYFEELSCEEAAKVLKMNRKQVYNLLYRGKNALRTILEEGRRSQ